MSLRVSEDRTWVFTYQILIVISSALCTGGINCPEVLIYQKMSREVFPGLKSSSKETQILTMEANGSAQM